jgi:hypothetical protein
MSNYKQAGITGWEYRPLSAFGCVEGNRGQKGRVLIALAPMQQQCEISAMETKEQMVRRQREEAFERTEKKAKRKEGEACRPLERPPARNVGVGSLPSTLMPNSASKKSIVPRARKVGRPRVEEKSETFEAEKPWLEMGMSRRTWYARRKAAGVSSQRTKSGDRS